MEQFYTSINKFIWKHPFFKGCIHFVSRFCPYMVAIFYSLFLLKIYLEWESQLFYFIKHPIYSVIIVIILRLIINRERPIQKYNLKPVDGLRRKNYSFPSIQVASSLSIALTVLKYGPNMGLLLTTLAIAIIISRFLSGQHYLTDILASTVIVLIINYI